MNLVAKLRRLSADVEEIKLALADIRLALTKPDPSPEPINLPDQIAPAIVAELPRKRGRPPKPKS